jgi:hypothetical protein
VWRALVNSGWKIRFWEDNSVIGLWTRATDWESFINIQTSWKMHITEGKEWRKDLLQLFAEAVVPRVLFRRDREELGHINVVRKIILKWRFVGKEKKLTASGSR